MALVIRYCLNIFFLKFLATSSEAHYIEDRSCHKKTQGNSNFYAFNLIQHIANEYLAFRRPWPQGYGNQKQIRHNFYSRLNGYLIHETEKNYESPQFTSVAQFCLTICDPHGLQHARPPCPSPTPAAYSNSCPLSP